jgi:hypothetical protein
MRARVAGGADADVELPPAVAVLGMTVEALSPRHRQRTTKANRSFAGTL